MVLVVGVTIDASYIGVPVGGVLMTSLIGVLAYGELLFESMAMRFSTVASPSASSALMSIPTPPRERDDLGEPLNTSEALLGLRLARRSTIRCDAGLTVGDSDRPRRPWRLGQKDKKSCNIV